MRQQTKAQSSRRITPGAWLRCQPLNVLTRTGAQLRVLHTAQSILFDGVRRVAERAYHGDMTGRFLFAVFGRVPDKFYRGRHLSAVENFFTFYLTALQLGHRWASWKGRQICVAHIAQILNANLAGKESIRSEIAQE